MNRVVDRVLPDGYIGHFQPFHVCIKGLETALLCREDDDYDAMVKVLCVSARRKNVIVIIYAVVSNHCHAAILAMTQADADAYAKDIKKVYSMWVNKKYGDRNILHRVESKAICLDNPWYIRNALAYIPRNALDNGCCINEYPWSGYGAMFRGPLNTPDARRVSGLTQRERIAIMHTGDDLKNVPWLIDGKNRLIPDSFCDKDYLEQAFDHDAAFWLKTIGGQNSAELHYVLGEKPYQMITDSEFIKDVEETCQRWFKQGIANLSMDQKTRIAPYLYRTRKTSIPQLSRVLGLTRERLSSILKR